jgi:hypothetical protein
MGDLTEHFSIWELQCRCGCEWMPFTMNAVERLEALRLELGFPFHITSAARCSVYNSKVSRTGPHGPHTIYEDDNITVDISVSHDQAYELIKLAPWHGWTGIGVQQKGIGSGRFIHIDRLPSNRPEHPRPRVWSY